jgi:hypothetical protein
LLNTCYYHYYYYYYYYYGYYCYCYYHYYYYYEGWKRMWQTVRSQTGKESLTGRIVAAA